MVTFHSKIKHRTAHCVDRWVFFGTFCFCNSSTCSTDTEANRFLPFPFSVRDKRFLFGLGGLRSWFSFSWSSAIAALARSSPNTQPTSEQNERDGRTELDGDEQQNKTRETAELNWTATSPFRFLAKTGLSSPRFLKSWVFPRLFRIFRPRTSARAS